VVRLEATPIISTCPLQGAYNSILIGIASNPPGSTSRNPGDDTTVLIVQKRYGRTQFHTDAPQKARQHGSLGDRGRVAGTGGVPADPSRYPLPDPISECLAEFSKVETIGHSARKAGEKLFATTGPRGEGIEAVV
jgi:hypothetical protein